MVHKNYEHHNTTVPEGVFGGAICLCADCKAHREHQHWLMDKAIAEGKAKPLKFNDSVKGGG